VSEDAPVNGIACKAQSTPATMSKQLATLLPVASTWLLMRTGIMATAAASAKYDLWSTAE